MIKYNVCEMFYSIQGESSYSGFPTVFIRFTGCNLRCLYCDSKYSYENGELKSIDEILEFVDKYASDYVCLTGGEPLLQDNLGELINNLLKKNKKVSIETNGSIYLTKIAECLSHENLKIVMDIKTLSSRMNNKNFFDNLNYLTFKDEIKFVCGNKEDFDYSLDIIKKYKLEDTTNLIFSPVFGQIKSEDLVNYLLISNLKNARFQLQIHKFVWNPEQRGV